jgi:hypothetical protein
MTKDSIYLSLDVRYTWYVTFTLQPPYLLKGLSVSVGCQSWAVLRSQSRCASEIICPCWESNPAYARHCSCTIRLGWWQLSTFKWIPAFQGNMLPIFPTWKTTTIWNTYNFTVYSCQSTANLCILDANVLHFLEAEIVQAFLPAGMVFFV